MLATIYNDLKGFAFFNTQLGDNYRQPLKDELTYHSGEYNGYNLQLYKLFIATLHEFFKFLEVNKNIFNNPKFFLIFKKISNPRQKDWKELVEIASGRAPSSPAFKKILNRTRNNIAFHYYESDKILREGFIKRFLKSENDVSNNGQFSYYAIGESLAKTRFFYADAATQEFLQSITEVQYPSAIEEYGKKAAEIINQMNDTIYSLLKEYIVSLHEN